MPDIYLANKEYPPKTCLDVFSSPREVKSIIPYEDISHIKSNGSTETETIKGNKNDHEEEVPQNIAELLTQSKSFKQHDKFVINSLIMSLEKPAAGEEYHCKNIAIAMKARME